MSGSEFIIAIPNKGFLIIHGSSIRFTDDRSGATSFHSLHEAQNAGQNVLQEAFLIMQYRKAIQ